MIYFNNSATSYPKPEAVITAVNDYAASIPCNSSRSGFKNTTHDILLSCREKIATLIHTDQVNNIIFTSGGTESLNLAIFGFNFRNSHIITTSTEHNSVYRPLKLLEKKGLAELSIVHTDRSARINTKDIEAQIKSNTSAVVVNHCSNVTGHYIDLEALGRITRKHGIKLIADASQSIGASPIDVEKCNIDILCFTGHKQLYGFQGIGGIYIKDSLSLTPLKVGGTGIRSELLYQPEYMPLYYEAGTPNMIGIVSLNAGLDFILTKGLDNIIAKKTELFSYLIERITRIENVVLYSDNSIPKNAVLPFNIKDTDPEEAGYILEHSFNILIRSGLHCAPLIHQDIGTAPSGCLRLSLSFFNTFTEIDTFINAVKEIAESK